MVANTHRKSVKSTIVSLEDHPEPYVTVAMLAAYWNVSRKQIYKQIDMGTLTAVKLGPRLFRIQRSEALRFERGAKMRPVDADVKARLDAVPTRPAKATTHVRDRANTAVIAASGRR